MTENNVVPFPKSAPASVPDLTSMHHEQFMARIGSQRLVFDIYSQVTELNPEPALVVPFAKAKHGKGKCGKHRRSRVVGDSAAG